MAKAGRIKKFPDANGQENWAKNLATDVAGKSQIVEVLGMHCQHCVEKIGKALQALPVTNISRNPDQIVFSQPVALKLIKQKMAEAGDYQLGAVRFEPNRPVALGESRAAANGGVTGGAGFLRTYYPLGLIITAISLVSLKGSEDWIGWMLNFEAGFFLVFGFFKLLDLRGFKDAYATYDLLAKKYPSYGYVYPFLELALGLLLLFRIELTLVFYAMVILMGFSSLGVMQALLKKQKIRCACLGTVLNLPMSVITLVEDLMMVGMALMMLAMGIS